MTEQQHLNEGNYYHKNRDGESATSSRSDNQQTKPEQPQEKTTEQDSADLNEEDEQDSAVGAGAGGR